MPSVPTRVVIAGLAGLLTVAVPGEAQESLVPAGATLEMLWNDGEFTEGVATAPDGTVYFSDIPRTDKRGRVLKYNSATGETTVHCSDSGKSNGLMFDSQGRLFACCGANNGLRGLCEITPAGDVKVLVDRFEGQRFNSPNDLVIHPAGRIYFSDPRYIGAEPVELAHQSVYCFTPSTGTLQRVTMEISKPNGVMVSPDGMTLYVAETDNGQLDVTQPAPVDVKRRMTLNRFDIHPDGTLGDRQTLVDFGARLGIDGMTVDVRGNVYAALRSDDRHGIVICSPDGRELGFLPTADLPTNCCFGRGDESKILYVTAGGGLHRVPLVYDGYHPGDAGPGTFN